MSSTHEHATTQFDQFNDEVALRCTQNEDNHDDTSACIRMLPSKILFSQDNIKSQFLDNKKLEDTFGKLLRRELTEDDIEPIEVVKDDSGLWWVLHGHRRLFLYKILERIRHVDTIPVKVLDIEDNKVRRLFEERKKTTTNGKSITVRDCPRLAGKLRQIGKEFVATRHRGLSINSAANGSCGTWPPPDPPRSPETPVDYPFTEFDEMFDRKR